VAIEREEGRGGGMVKELTNKRNTGKRWEGDKVTKVYKALH
jgi:hypothetical protein